MIADYEFRSDFKELITQYVSIKRTVGLKFDTHEHCLYLFDKFCLMHGCSGVHITKEMLELFVYDPLERPSSHYRKECVMRNFAVYLADRGYTVYIPENISLPPKSSFVPHIFTSDEIKRFFDAADKYPTTQNTNRKSVDPVLFRFLYGTGTRISEALNLTVSNIDVESGTAEILHSKNNKSRIVPMADSLTLRVHKYIDEFHRLSDNGTPLFPGRNMGIMNKSTAYNHFRDYLLAAGIPHTATGPRVHDFRHHFAVKCLKKWTLEGIHLENTVPYLSAYMGHTDFRETQYYLRLTSELYPDILKKSEAEFGYVIPDGGMSDEA